jgi:hypothetical protein
MPTTRRLGSVRLAGTNSGADRRRRPGEVTGFEKEGEMRMTTVEEFLDPMYQATLPPALWKATHDSYVYWMKLRTGELLRFERARIDGEWVHLHNCVHLGPFPHQTDDFNLGRGMDVRLSDIVWVVDSGS